MYKGTVTILQQTSCLQMTLVAKWLRVEKCDKYIHCFFHTDA